MKKIKIVLILLLFCNLSHAEPVYLWVKKSDEGNESRGDVLAITPATAQYEPTPSELIHVFVVEADLTNEEQNELLIPLFKDEVIDFEGEKIPKKTEVAPRATKLDVDTLDIQQNKEKLAKNEIVSNIIVKPSAAVIE